MTQFERDLKKGKIGEELVRTYLKEANWDFEDVSDNENYFAADIDFILHLNNTTIPLDVKYDTRMSETGNMFIENFITYADGRCKRGWLHYSEAEYIWYIDAATNTAFIFLLDDMKDYVRTARVSQRTCKDGYKDVDGYCVNPVDFAAAGYNYQIKKF